MASLDCVCVAGFGRLSETSSHSAPSRRHLCSPTRHQLHARDVVFGFFPSNQETLASRGWNSRVFPGLYCCRLFSEAQKRGLFSAVPEGVGAGTERTHSEEMLEQLQCQMDIATSREDYVGAASIRDTINSLLEKDPALRLKIQINKSISEERYEDAANYRDELERLGQTLRNDLSCFSDMASQGIRVQARSAFVKDRSQPCTGHYFFAYHIRISNECSRPVQLLSRHWVITDANGRIEQIRGMGVIGERPVLLPGTNFEYTSACPLGTATGRMEGDFCIRYDEVRRAQMGAQKLGLGFKLLILGFANSKLQILFWLRLLSQ